MRVALIAKDKPNHLELRLENRAAHIEYLKATDVVEQAGPLLSETGEMVGSLIILMVDDMEQAQRWADNDPYGQAGLFASVELIAWNKVI